MPSIHGQWATLPEDGRLHGNHELNGSEAELLTNSPGRRLNENDTFKGDLLFYFHLLN